MTQSRRFSCDRGGRRHRSLRNGAQHTPRCRASQMRRALGVAAGCGLAWLCALSGQAQTLSAGFGGGWTSLGGLGVALGLPAPSALSGNLFLDFEAGAGANVRLSASVAVAGALTLSAFETDFVWRFPLGRLAGLAGGGVGLFGLPAALSPGLHLSFAALAGIEHRLFRLVHLSATIQALTVLRLGRGFFPGAPLLRVEVGLAMPF